MSAALAALRTEGARALVIDLRRCPGGALTAAIEVTELFLENDRRIVSTRGRARNQNMSFSAHPPRHTRALAEPLAVLVDEGTASGCEIIGAALQEWQRAQLVGTRTSGLTTIQTILPLANGAALRLTTARWFTPKGRSLEGEGLVPDAEVALDEAAARSLGDPLHDAQLRRAVDIVDASSPR